MASLQAPVRGDPAERVPIDLVVVIDTSGSMSGDRIKLTQITTKFVVNNLHSGDYFSLVQYNSFVRVEEPLNPYNKKNVKNIEQIIDSLHATGGTNLSEGLEEGIHVAVGSKSENKVSAVLLLTDGHASVHNPAGIIARARGDKTCNVFCFGFGADHDAKLLQKIADEGNGLYYFIEKEADISSAFADCLGGLISVAAQKMILTIEPLSGVTIKKVLGSKKASKKGAPAPAPSGSNEIKVQKPRSQIKHSASTTEEDEDEKPTPNPEEQKRKR